MGICYIVCPIGSTSQQQALFIESPTRPIVSTNVEHFGMLRSEGHSHSSTKDDLIVLKTMKQKCVKRIRVFGRSRNCLKVEKSLKYLKPRLAHDFEKAMNDIFYDTFRVKKHDVIKSRGMIVEKCFFEES